MKRVLLLFLVVVTVAPTISKDFKHDVIIFKRQEKSRSKTEMKPVVFPHKLHADMMNCSSCHNNLFKPKLGANRINMKQIMEGKACGACHNGVKAWPAFHCTRCHKGK